MKNIFKINALNSRASVGLLIFRVVVGLAFMFHGWSKIQSPMSWMPPESGVPGFLQFLAAISEFGGGLSWILGLLMPLSCFGLLCTMGFATFFHVFVLHGPFVGQQGAYEPALVYFVTAIMLFLVGPGKFSLDQKIFGTKN